MYLSVFIRFCWCNKHTQISGAYNELLFLVYIIYWMWVCYDSASHYFFILESRLKEQSLSGTYIFLGRGGKNGWWQSSWRPVRWEQQSIQRPMKLTVWSHRVLHVWDTQNQSLQRGGSYRFCSHVELMTSIQVSLAKASHLAKPVQTGQRGRVVLQKEGDT